MLQMPNVLVKLDDEADLEGCKSTVR